MSEKYYLAYHESFARELERLSFKAGRDPRAPEVQYLKIAIAAFKVIQAGEEAKHRGERLGFDQAHYDLRDCAEIKVSVLKEYSRNRRPLGPSHRLIYREFEPTADDPRPIRQIVAFEHRKDGLPFKVAAERLGRAEGSADPSLAALPNTRPAIGKHKDPDRPITPYRMPLPPDLAAALATAQTALPTRTHARPSSNAIRSTDPPVRHRVRER